MGGLLSQKGEKSESIKVKKSKIQKVKSEACFWDVKQELV